jgi:hypothetical protein
MQKPTAPLQNIMMHESFLDESSHDFLCYSEFKSMGWAMSVCLTLPSSWHEKTVDTAFSYHKLNLF